MKKKTAKYNVVDSSAWIEYFKDGPNADFFAAAIEDSDHLIVPAICIYEVFKRLLLTVEESEALARIADMHTGRIAEMTGPLALAAAQISVENKLAMADSFILATAQAHNAALWTQDADFEGLRGVMYPGAKKRTK